MATIQTGWSDAAANIGAIFSSSNSTANLSLPISTINSVLNSGLPAQCRITNIKIVASIRFECSTLAVCNCRVGYGGSGSLSQQLASHGPSSGSLNWSSSITANLNAVIDGRQLSTKNGTHITYNFTSNDWGKKTYEVKNVYLDVAYETPFTLTVSSNDTSYGTTSGGGAYYNGATATLTATPNTGYKFVKWSDGNTSATRTVTVTGNATYTATFEPITYYVAFHGNGATAGSVATKSYKYNENVYLPSCGFTKTLTADWKPNGDNVDIEYTHLEGNCTFKGWSFSSSADASVYQVGEGFTNLTNKDGETVNIYAQWSKYTFVFPNISRSGYKFIGWKDDLTGELAQYINSLETYRSFSYTAQWEVDKINKIYVGTSQPKEIYVGTSLVKAIYVGTTKVYG